MIVTLKLANSQPDDICQVSHTLYKINQKINQIQYDAYKNQNSAYFALKEQYMSSV